MLGRSHRLCSIALVEGGLLASNHLITNQPLPLVVLLVATGIGSTLPDLDQHNSTASRHSPINFSLFLSHRGITHSILGWIIFSGVIYFLMNYLLPIPLNLSILESWWGCIWLGLSVGYILHLVEDGFSKQGINWLWPITKKPLKLPPHYKVGGYFEKVLVAFAEFGILIMTVYWVLTSMSRFVS